VTTSQLSTKQRGTTAIWILSLSPLLWLACHRSLPLVSGPDRIGPHHADAASGITPDGAGEAGSDSAADRRPDTGAPSDGAPDAGDGGVALDAPSPCPIDSGPACAIPHTLLTCDDGVGCTAAVCAPGYANCDVSNPACETPIAATPAASGACVPQYQGTRQVSDGRYQDSATAVAADGSFFLGGTFTGTVDFDPSAGTDLRTAGDADGYITKLNADGSYAWTATLIGPTGITLAALAATPAGGVVATGTYSVSIDLDPGPGTDLHRTNGSSHGDPFIVELGADGSWSWGATFAGDFNQPGGSGAGVAVDGAGAAYLAGSFSGNIDFDPRSRTRSFFAPAPTGFLVKLTPTGQFAWAHTFLNGGCASALVAVAVATEGNVWSTGTAQTGEGCTILRRTGQAPQNDVLVVKLTPVGGTLAIWTLGDVALDSGVAIAPGDLGSMYIGGIAAGTVTFDPLAMAVKRWIDPVSTSSFVLKLQMNGKAAWVRPLNGVTLTALAPARDGGVLAAGAGSPALVARLTSSGDAAWTTIIGGAGSTALSLAAAGNRFVVAGHSTGSNDFDPGPGVDPFDGNLSFVSVFTY